MFRILVLVSVALIALTLSAWEFDGAIAGATGSSQQCVDGVMYIQFTSGASVKYLPDGKIANC